MGRVPHDVLASVGKNVVVDTGKTARMRVLEWLQMVVLLEEDSKAYIGVVDKNKQRNVLGVAAMVSEMLVVDDVAEHLEFVDVMAGADVEDIAVEDDLELPD